MSVPFLRIYRYLFRSERNFKYQVIGKTISKDKFTKSAEGIIISLGMEAK